MEGTFWEAFNQPDPTAMYNFNVEDAQEELQVNTGDITTEEVKNVIKSLKNNKVAGLEEKTAEILKYGGLSMAEKPASLFNNAGRMVKSQRTGKFPRKALFGQN